MVTLSIRNSKPGAMNFRNKPKETHKIISSPNVSSKVTRYQEGSPFNQGQKGPIKGEQEVRLHPVSARTSSAFPPSLLELLCHRLQSLY